MAGRSAAATGEMMLLGNIVAACREPSDTPLPRPVLALVRELLHAEEVSFLGIDTRVGVVRFDQHLAGDGAHGCETEALTEAEAAAFWSSYWDPRRKWCLPDVTGDYTLVYTADDLASLRQRRAWHDTTLGPFVERLVQAVLPGRSPGQHVRLTGWRDGSNFTEKDVLFLRLLQPHLERAYAENASGRRAGPRLTSRQLQVMRMVQAGLTNRQIARRLGVSEGTVHSHLTNIYELLAVQSRTAAVHAVFHTTEDWST